MILKSLLTFLLSLLPQEQPPTAEILFAGDAMQHGPQLSAAKTKDGRYDFNTCFIALDSIVKAADFAVVNLETPVGNKTFSGYPCFSAPVSYATALKDTGFDMLLTGNNHTLDRGAKGLRRTVEVLDSIGVYHLGTYPNDITRKEALPLIVDINGFKVGFLNYTYDTNGIQPTGGVIVDYIDHSVIEKDIQNTRDAGAELICVAMHWGDEYQLLPVTSEKKHAQFLIDQGVDIIFGGHPHVIQPMKLIKNETTGRNTALIYSLGNFISNMNTRDTRGGAIAKVVLNRNDEGIAYVEKMMYRLVYTLKPQKTGQNYRVVPAETVTDNWQCSDFVKSATNIFKTHNVSISTWE